MKKRILFIGTRPIYPMKDGRTVLINQYCEQFTACFDYEVYYVCFGLTNVEQPKYLTAVYPLEEPSVLEMGKNIIIKTFLLHKLPIQASVMYAKKTQKKLDEVIKKVHPAYIFCDMARTAPYLHKYSQTEYVKILDMDDLLSKRYARQADLKNLDDSVLGQFKKKIPSIFITLVSRLHLIKSILQFEAKMMEKYELRVVKEFHKTFFCSAVDTKEFNQRSSYKAMCVHTAVDLQYFSIVQDKSYDNKTIGYLGNIDIAANRDSLTYLIEKIMPKVLQKDSSYKLLVVGNCSRETYKRFEKYHFVKFSFRVDDIRPYVQRCAALAAPIQYGSGIKIKIIEAMAMGVPVITNKYGTEGLDVNSYHELISCENDGQFVNAIMEISGNEELRKSLSVNGREYVEKNHSLDRCRRDLKRILEE